MNCAHRFMACLAAFAFAFASGLPAIAVEQHGRAQLINAGERMLQFDWPAVRIGTGEYPDGPTGVTVFHFPGRALGAVDVRGGGPGTVNTDYLRLGYDLPELDAVVFSGGSWYGLENTTAVATAMKDDGLRDGDWTNLALVVGAIIYDFGGRRFNEIHPDKPLAQTAYRAARPGVFPLGAHGAGRNAMSGSLFGCNANSGQGGAYRRIGELRIAAFTVVNSLGVVTRRDGRVAACHVDTGWPQDLRAADLLAGYPASGQPGWSPAAEPARRNTTISLVVTNLTLKPPELQRLAIQVHSSMSRGLQPFATEFDGDVLYAVSTGELPAAADGRTPSLMELGIAASELMWDAILSSVPEQPVAATPAKRGTATQQQLAGHAGDYVFSPYVGIHITAEGARLYGQAVGQRDAYAIGRATRVELLPVDDDTYTVPGRYPLTLRFDGAGRLVVNPGHWQQVGVHR